MFKNQLYFLVIILFTFGCNEHPELVPQYPSTINGGLVRAQVESLNDDEMIFIVDFFMVNTLGNYVTVKEEDVSMTMGIDGNIGLETDLISLECSKDFETTEPGALSLSILVDQSGSVSSSDSLNLRVQASQKIVEAMRPNDEVALMIFGGGDTINVPNVLVDFSEQEASFTPALNGLTTGIGGATPLFEGLYGSILYTTENAKNQSKAVVVLTDEGASDEAERADSVICLANNGDVNIHIIKFGGANQNQLLNNLVVGTAGVAMPVETALNITSLSNFYDEFVVNEVYDFFYRSTWKVKRSWGDWNSGFYLGGNLKVRYEDGLGREFPFTLLVCP